MPVTETSKESYRKIEDLGDKQREVYAALQAMGSATDRELTERLDWEINQLLPRRGELRDLGFIKKVGEKYNPATKRNVTVWGATNPMADRAVEKIVGKNETKKESDPKMKYLLKLKNGQRFTITAAMKDEIEEAMAAKRSKQSVTVANHVFVLSNIAMPITEFGNAPAAAAPVKEDFREEVLIEIDGAWQVTNQSESQLRRERIVFRTRKIGVTTGTIKQDLMTLYDGPYESVRDMLQAGRHE